MTFGTNRSQVNSLVVNIQKYLNKIATKGFIALSYTIIQS
jgi:hypothetical protein